jgi:hypothetical protein
MMMMMIAMVKFDYDKKSDIVVDDNNDDDTLLFSF